ncbi:hypothetical protein KIF24_01050 [Micromonospora sp. Llam7]|uniref:hypothetical protein n=1 Tax=Micromonospora tarapacensis TaxID=2835305 RepID=UPI001C83DD7C|nr:hypothetical protein [Micromonospora tarapacensis]MBX7264779.1 hypothetical protein [Micromonospora tarapacensis]
MDEPDWDEQERGEPDWVYDPPAEEDGYDLADTGAGPKSHPVGIAKIRQHHPKAYRLWTRQADSELMKGYLAGRSIDELAVSFERQSSAVQRRLERLAFVELSRHRTVPGAPEPG